MLSKSDTHFLSEHRKINYTVHVFNVYLTQGLSYLNILEFVLPISSLAGFYHFGTPCPGLRLLPALLQVLSFVAGGVLAAHCNSDFLLRKNLHISSEKADNSISKAFVVELLSRYSVLSYLEVPSLLHE